MRREVTYNLDLALEKVLTWLSDEQKAALKALENDKPALLAKVFVSKGTKIEGSFRLKSTSRKSLETPRKKPSTRSRRPANTSLAVRFLIKIDCVLRTIKRN